jgi:hypothetical protein
MNDNFSFDDFKKWMLQQNGFSSTIPRINYIGISVDSNIPKRKLSPYICVRDGTLEELVNDFSKHGGIVVDIDGKHLVIEVNSGSFSIPENCVRRR